MIKYYKLWRVLDERGMKRKDLGISSKTLAKMTKGENITTDIIDKICEMLDVQPSDIMEYVKKTGEA